MYITVHVRKHEKTKYFPPNKKNNVFRRCGLNRLEELRTVFIFKLKKNGDIGYYWAWKRQKTSELFDVLYIFQFIPQKINYVYNYETNR